jgi:hypothetical protein
MTYKTDLTHNPILRDTMLATGIWPLRTVGAVSWVSGPASVTVLEAELYSPYGTWGFLRVGRRATVFFGPNDD